MIRALRIEFGRALYHVISGSTERRAIAPNAADRRKPLAVEPKRKGRGSSIPNTGLTPPSPRQARTTDGQTEGLH